MSRNHLVENLCAGETYADVLTWHWERSRSHWWAEVRRDGTKLVVEFNKRGRGRSFWRAKMIDHEVHTLSDEYKHPNQAQVAVFEFYKKKYPIEDQR